MYVVIPTKGEIMKKYFQILKQCPLFYGIEEEDFATMLNCLGATIVNFNKNEIIFSEGSSAKYVGIVLFGAVQVIRDDYSGNRAIVTTIEQSQLFGEVFACANVNALPVSVIAKEYSEIMLIDCKGVTKTCGNSCKFHNSLIINLLQIVANKNLLLNKKIEITSKRTTREKLLTYFFEEAKQNNSKSFTIPYDRQSLADYLGVERSAMSAEISKLRNDGLLECTKNRIKLL